MPLDVCSDYIHWAMKWMEIPQNWDALIQSEEAHPSLICSVVGTVGPSEQDSHLATRARSKWSVNAFNISSAWRCASTFMSGRLIVHQDGFLCNLPLMPLSAEDLLGPQANPLFLEPFVISRYPSYASAQSNATLFSWIPHIFGLVLMGTCVLELCLIRTHTLFLRVTPNSWVLYNSSCYLDLLTYKVNQDLVCLPLDRTKIWPRLLPTCWEISIPRRGTSLTRRWFPSHGGTLY